MLLDQPPAHAGHVHDRKNAGAPVIILAGRYGIAKQPANIRIAFAAEPRHARRNEGIDLARLQHLRDGLSFRSIFEADA